MQNIKSVATGLYMGIAAIGLTTVSAHDARAVLLAADLSDVAGLDTFITRDTMSGLDWLDVNLTRNTSFNELIGGVPISNIEPNGLIGALNGLNPVTGFTNAFRHATRAELLTLFSNASIPDVNVSLPVFAYTQANFIPVSALISLLGGQTNAANCPILGCAINQLDGVYDQVVGPGIHALALISTCVSFTVGCFAGDDDISGLFRVGRVINVSSSPTFFQFDDQGRNAGGHFLVRATPAATNIPEPQSWALLLVGLTLLVGLQLQRRNKIVAPAC